MPRVYATPVNTIQLSIRLDPETNEILRRVAFQGRISVTEAARRILAGALNPKMAGVPVHVQAAYLPPFPAVVPDASGNGNDLQRGRPCTCDQCTKAALATADHAKGSPS